MPLPPEYLTTAPPSFWPTVAGAAIALAGVVLTDWRNTRRQRIQHAFDAQQKMLDRTMALRQELYAPMADVIGETVHYLMQMPEIKLDESRNLVNADTRPLAKLAAACTKLLVIAEVGTAVLAQQLESKVGQVHSVLLDAQKPLINACMKTKANEIARAEIEREFDRVTASLDLHFESGKKKDAAFINMESKQNKYFQEIERSQNEHSALLVREQAERIGYLRVLDEHGPALQDLTVALFISMRNELTGASDNSALEAELRRALQLDKAASKRTLDSAMAEMQAR